MPGELENQRISRLIPLDDVLAAIAAVAAVAPRTVALSAALDRVLAEDIVAVADQPATARALRDGYALRAEETSDAGSYAPLPLAAAVRVDVGEALPAGADAVVPFDAVVERGGRFEAIASTAPGEGVLSRGADLRGGMSSPAPAGGSTISISRCWQWRVTSR